MFEHFETTRETSTILAEARQMRDEAVARMIANGWRGLTRLLAKLTHGGHLPARG